MCLESGYPKSVLFPALPQSRNALIAVMRMLYLIYITWMLAIYKLFTVKKIHPPARKAQCIITLSNIILKTRFQEQAYYIGVLQVVLGLRWQLGPSLNNIVVEHDVTWLHHFVKAIPAAGGWEPWAGGHCTAWVGGTSRHYKHGWLLQVGVPRVPECRWMGKKAAGGGVTCRSKLQPLGQFPHWLHLWEVSREGGQKGWSHDHRMLQVLLSGYLGPKFATMRPWGPCDEWNFEDQVWITLIQCHCNFERLLKGWL